MNQFFYAASIVILLCTMFGVAASSMAFRKFAVSAVRPLLGWTILSQFFLCLTLLVEESRNLLFNANEDGFIDRRWYDLLSPWPSIMLGAKVSLAASVVFTAVMVAGLLFRRDEPTILGSSLKTRPRLPLLLRYMTHPRCRHDKPVWPCSKPDCSIRSKQPSMRPAARPRSSGTMPRSSSARRRWLTASASNAACPPIRSTRCSSTPRVDSEKETSLC